MCRYTYEMPTSPNFASRCKKTMGYACNWRKFQKSMRKNFLTIKLVTYVSPYICSCPNHEKFLCHASMDFSEGTCMNGFHKNCKRYFLMAYRMS
jgi:hypothetical protein